jgi:hypothetical protein
LKGSLLQILPNNSVDYGISKFVSNESSSKKRDVYNFGQILWKLFHGDEVPHPLSEDKFNSKKLRHMFLACTTDDAKDRPTFQEVTIVI